MVNIDELKATIAHWEEVESNGGSPTSAAKLSVAKEALAEAEAAIKPAKKAKVKKSKKSKKADKES